MMDRAILISGAAGFVGFHVARQMLAENRRVVGLDNLNTYYDPALKHSRLDILRQDLRFSFIQADLADRPQIASLFAKNRFEVVLHFAAQAGVRYSIEQPQPYADANLQGFLNILEGCRHHGCRHLIYASSSSVYGANTKLPFSVRDRTDHPVSLYAATKKANELMAYSYSHLYNLPVTGLRFFTVYGPWGRPDMAIFLFTKAIVEGRPIKLFNHGRMWRDFTHIADVTKVVSKLVESIPAPDPNAAGVRSKIYNVGNHRPEKLLHIVSLLEKELGRTAEIELLPMQPGDLLETFADVDDLMHDTGFKPAIPIEDGIHDFVLWYRNQYKV